MTLDPRDRRLAEHTAAALTTVTALSIRLRFTAERRCTLPPDIGPMLYGAFGTALYTTACTQPGVACVECGLAADCAYGSTFEGLGPEHLRIGQLPRPYALDAGPPQTRPRQLQAGANVVADIHLVGQAAQHAAAVVEALRGAAAVGFTRQRHPFRLTSALVLTRAGHVQRLDSSAQPLAGLTRPVAGPPPAAPVERAEIALQTGVRIKVRKRWLERLVFEDLVRALERRVHLLSTAWCGGPLDLDLGALLTAARRVRTVTEDVSWYGSRRGSNRQGRTVATGGLRGTVTYEGPITALVPLLHAGEILGVGNRTTQGGGRYRVSILPS